MKATRNILVMLIAAAIMTFAACGEKEPEPQPQPTLHNYDLSGTTWESHIVSTYMYMGTIEMDIDQLYSLDFTNDTAGEMFVDVSMEMPSYPAGNQTQNYTEPFTYKFDGTILTLTVVDDTSTYTDQYNYDRENNTFWQEIPNESYQGINMRELYGTDRIVYQLVRGSFSL